MKCKWCGQPIVQKDDGTYKHEKYAGIGSYHTAEPETRAA